MCKCIKIIFIELQNGRRVEAGKNVWKSSSPMPLPDQGQLEQIAQHSAQLDFKCFESRKDGDAAASLGNVVQCLTTLT